MYRSARWSPAKALSYRVPYGALSVLFRTACVHAHIGAAAFSYGREPRAGGASAIDHRIELLVVGDRGEPERGNRFLFGALVLPVPFFQGDHGTL